MSKLCVLANDEIDKLLDLWASTTCKDFYILNFFSELQLNFAS